MININHPKAHGKPPLVKRHTSQKDVENDECNKEEITPILEEAKDAILKIAENVDDADVALRVDKGMDEMNLQVKCFGLSDYNQNVIDSTACSFEQLCAMINDLEKNISTEIPKVNHLQFEPERDTNKTKCRVSGSTYEEIMSFLEKLEEDGTKAEILEPDSLVFQELPHNVPPSSYLNCVVNSSKVENHIPRAFEEDLATARLQLEEKDATITVLKNQLKIERKSACEKLESQRKSDASKMQAQEEKYKGIVRRHQKFIEQLITEKTDLTEKCNSLAQRIKETEMKVQRDLKAATDRHLVELQRAKERYAAAEKIKRERWLEARTLKIKEMTVKGLEPELRNMVEQHEEEIQKLRSAHIKELQDVELQLIRRCNQQLEQLRLELTASHDQMLTNEKNILSSRYKEMLEEQEAQFQARYSKLVEELQHEKARFVQEQAKHEAERDAILYRAHMQHQQEIEAIKQRQVAEKRSLEEALKTEWETWLVDYKRQQTIKLERAENKIREDCVRERDRQIELAIARLEKDSQEIQTNLQQNYENKIRSLKEKCDMDLQVALENENMHRDKLSVTKDKLDKVEIELQKANAKLQEYENDLTNANESIKRLTEEKENAKRYARQEIEAEKRELEEKIASLYREITENNSNRDVALAQLQSRIKLIMTQKILTIRNLMKELSDSKTKCEHLEKLLDQQRKEYILQSL